MANVAGFTGKYTVKGKKGGDKPKEMWFYVLTLGKDAKGKRIQIKKRGFKSEREAAKALREAQVEADKGKYVKPSTTTYSEYMDEWFRDKKHSLGYQTAQVNEGFIQHHILPSLGNAKMADMNPTIIKKFINDLREKGLADGTVKRIFNIVNASLKAAYVEQIIPRNPASLLETKPKVTQKEVQVWDEKQVKQFLNTVQKSKTRYYMAFHLALATGMRQGEILGLRWADVDFERGLISVRQTLSHDGKQLKSGAKTKTSIRTISIDPKTVHLLQKLRRIILSEKLHSGSEYKDNDLVVCTSVGTPCSPRNLSRIWYDMLKKSELPTITFHDLRHTHASLLLKNNVHPKIVSERLGHSKIQITIDLYSHLFPNMQEEAAHELGKMLFSN